MNELDEIAKEIIACTKCRLHLTRRNAVPGEGNPRAEVMFIGEAPGETEDEQGRPFVGAAGKVLTENIEKILGMKRDQVFITNVVKCRPPNNRDPADDEIAACSPYLDRQIAVIRPKVIVTLGRHSTKYIFGKIGKEFRSIMAVRGSVIEADLGYGKVKIIPTLHPAATLYNPGLRKYFDEDFRKVAELLGVSEKNKSVTLLDFLDGSRDKGKEGNRDVL